MDSLDHDHAAISDILIKEHKNDGTEDDLIKPSHYLHEDLIKNIEEIQKNLEESKHNRK